jgi:P pilus assembly chaperone PapD
LLLALLLATGLAQAGPALPKWHMSTNRLDVPAGNLATDFTVTNDDHVNERFEVVAYAWTQSNGTDVRRPDVSSVLIFPRLFELAPGRSTRVRAGVLDKLPTAESDFRISVEQLFDPQNGKAGIHFLLAYDVPLFIAPAHAHVDARIVDISVRSRKLRVTVRNDGNVHVFARSIAVKWHSTVTNHSGPFYVLPRDTMTFTIPIRGCGDGPVTIVPDKDSRIPELSAPIGLPCARGALDERGIATLRINHIPDGDAVVVPESNDLYVRARDVADVSFPYAPSTKTIHGDVYDSLASSGIGYSYDPASLTLDLHYNVVTARRVVVATPSPALYANGTSAGVTYAATLDRDGTPEISERTTLVAPGAQVQLGFARENGVIARSVFGAIFSEHGQNGEIVSGDQTLRAGGTLPSMPLFGVGVEQGMMARTSTQRAPFERVSGTLAHPTTISIHISGEQPIELGIEPGSFSIDGIPVMAHVSAVDDLTNLPIQMTLAAPLGGQLIAPGWRELNLATGLPRVCLYACATYRGFVAGGSLLHGDSLFLASGPHAEYLDGRMGIGYDLVDADPQHELRLSAGLGPLDGALLSYQQRAGEVSFGFGYGTSGAPFYNDAGLFVMQRHSVSEMLNVVYRRLRFQYQSRSGPPHEKTVMYDLIDDIPVSRTSARLDLQDRIENGARGSISLGILLPLAIERWHNTTLLGTTIGAHVARSATLASQIDMPSGFEIGGGADGALQAAYISDAIAVSASDVGVLTCSGAFVLLHGIHPVRDISNGYAVAAGEPGDLLRDSGGHIHTVGASKATAFPLASSDRPTQIAYVPRNVSIGDNVTLSTSTIHPAPNAGALLMVAHTRLFAVIGVVADPKWRYGTIALSDGGGASPIGSDGMFYFEGLASGRHPAEISAGGAACNAVLDVPSSNERQINVGTISCSDPLRLRNVKEPRHRIEPSGIFRTHERELVPRRFTIAQRVTRRSETLARVIEIFAANSRPLLSVRRKAEIMREIARRVAPNGEAHARLSLLAVIEHRIRQERRVEQCSKCSDPGLIVVARAEICQHGIGEMTLHDGRNPVLSIAHEVAQ